MTTPTVPGHVDVDGELLDEDGYPTELALQRIRSWEHEKGWGAALDYIRELWWGGEMLWTEKQRGDRRVCDVSTGGWSGNEDLIAAMRGNFLLWSTVFLAHRRGGHYVFEIKERA